MGRTGITGLRFYLRWLRDSLYSTLCSAKARTSGEGASVLNSLFKPSGNGGFIYFLALDEQCGCSRIYYSKRQENQKYKYRTSSLGEAPA